MKRKVEGALGIASILGMLTRLVISQTCAEPTMVETEILAPPIAYYFTGDSPAMSLTPLAYTIEPEYCTIEFSCKQLSPTSDGGAPDLCSYESNFASTSFDPTTGVLKLSASDPNEFRDFSSQYKLQIIGTVGNLSALNEFTINFSPPCESPLRINEPDPFDRVINVWLTGSKLQILLNPMTIVS